MTKFRAVVTATYEVEVEAASTLWVPERAVALMRDVLPCDVRVSHIEPVARVERGGAAKGIDIHRDFGVSES